MPFQRGFLTGFMGLICLGQVLALDEIEITEWQVPWENTRPRDPFVDGEGRVWFVGQRGHYAAYLDSATGKFTRFDLAPGTGPHNLIVDDEGDVWYSGNLAAHIGRLDPETGEIARYPMPDPQAKDPHTMVFDRNGDIWFTVQFGNFIGKMSTGATRETRLIPLPTPRARPYGIVVDSMNRPWIAELGTNRIASVNPETLELQEYLLPEGARPRRLQATSTDQVWYVDYARGFLGHLDPVSGAVEEFLTPGGPGSKPYGMAVDSQDRLWLVETGSNPNRFVGFDPGTRKFFSVTAVGSGGGTIRHMMYHPPSQSIWFGTDTNTIGRAWVP